MYYQRRLQVVRDQTDYVYYRFAKRRLVKILELTGIKNQLIQNLANQIINSFPQNDTLTKNNFTSILIQQLVKMGYKKKQHKKPSFINHFKVAYKIITNQIPIIILIGGTTGTGKSTSANILGVKFEAQTILSTDSIRHILRNYLNKQQQPILFASTYQCHQFVDEKLSLQKRILKGYKIQSFLVQKYLQKIIQTYIKNRQTLVIQGVHLTPKFLKKMASRYSYVIPFFLYIKDQQKHKERFAVRSKYMSVQPKFTLLTRYNKYTASIERIRLIQKYLLDKCNQYIIPKVPNNNVDRCIESIFSTVIKYVQRFKKISKEDNCYEVLFQIYKKVIQKRGWIKKQLIRQNFLQDQSTEFSISINQKIQNRIQQNYNSIDGVSPLQLDIQQQSQITDLQQKY